MNDRSPYDLWKPVIGLEIHAQLSTRSKMFGPEPYVFGHEPNTDIGVVSTGQPGSLPVLNHEAVRLAVLFGLAIHANIARLSRFDRKSYFYPDAPKNFQITQYDHPILSGGAIPCDVDGTLKHFAVHRAHLEEDSGMLKHFTNFSGIDYNRSGVPLLEIVSEPCMHSPSDAAAYAMMVRAILQYIGACDGNMEEGSLRIDVNVSVQKKGETALRKKAEIKNMNSFDNMKKAIQAEIDRQIHFYTTHPDGLFEGGTHRFDLEKNTTVLMRAKEEAADYRYFPEPDLPPLLLTEALIDEVRVSLPELPHDRYKRYIEKLGLPQQPAEILIADKRLADYFEEGLAVGGNAKSLANWITVEFLGRCKEKGTDLWTLKLPSAAVAELVQCIDDGTITGRIAKSVADEMVEQPHKKPRELIAANPDYQPVSDEGAIATLIDQVMSEHSQSVTDYKAGKTKAFAFLIGQVMKASRGKADPAVVNALLMKKLQ